MVDGGDDGTSPTSRHAVDASREQCRERCGAAASDRKKHSASLQRRAVALSQAFGKKARAPQLVSERRREGEKRSEEGGGTHPRLNRRCSLAGFRCWRPDTRANARRTATLGTPHGHTCLGSARLETRRPLADRRSDDGKALPPMQAVHPR